MICFLWRLPDIDSSEVRKHFCHDKLFSGVCRNGWTINCAGTLRIMVGSHLSESRRRASGSRTLFYMRSKLLCQSYITVVHYKEYSGVMKYQACFFPQFWKIIKNKKVEFIMALIEFKKSKLVTNACCKLMLQEKNKHV